MYTGTAKLTSSQFVRFGKMLPLAMTVDLVACAVSQAMECALAERLFNITTNYITTELDAQSVQKFLRLGGLACVIYLPERFGEGKRRVTECRHNVII